MEITSKRKSYLIEKDFQIKFILRFCLLVVLAGIASAVIVYLLARSSTSVAIVNSRIVVRTTADFLIPILIQTFIVVTVMVGLATISVALLASHKIAGPLYRFKRQIQLLGKGDFSSGFKLRRMDQLQELAGVINTMITDVSSQLNAVKQRVSGLKNNLDSIQEEDVPAHKRVVVSELKKISLELEKIINSFKT